MEFGAGEGMRSLASVVRMAAAVLHPQQLGLALVEFVIADRGDRKPHHRERLDRRLVVEHRRQERARADQVAGGDEDRVLVPLAQLLDQRRHVLGAAGGDHHLLGSVLGIVDADAARRRTEIAVEIVDRENAQLDGRGGLGRRRAGRRARGQKTVRRKMMSHGTRLVVPPRRFHESFLLPTFLLPVRKRIERGRGLVRFQPLAEQMGFLVDAAGEFFRRRRAAACARLRPLRPAAGRSRAPPCAPRPRYVPATPRC